MNLSDQLYSPPGWSMDRGLTRDARRILEYLRRQSGPLTAGRIAHDVGVVDVLARLALRELTEKGQARRVPGTKQFLATHLTPPEAA